jgi:hypothetical protein
MRNQAIQPNTVLEIAVLLLLISRSYEVYRSDGLGWHDIHTKFHEDQFRHSSNITSLGGCGVDGRDSSSAPMRWPPVAGYAYKFS